MSRVQLALNVSDLEGAIAFYSTLFGAEPVKRRPGYANFAIAEPPLKLVLMQNADGRGAGVGGALNHLGVEVESTDLVTAAAQRLTGEGLDTLTQDATTCCYAVQDKVWVHDPDQVPWEVYTVLSDAAATSAGATDLAVPTSGCCLPSADSDATGHRVPVAASSACC